jgi:hypothetical protein
MRSPRLSNHRGLPQSWGIVHSFRGIFIADSLKDRLSTSFSL